MLDGARARGHLLSPRILIVEDEALIAADLADALETQGYEVVGMAGTGDSALGKLSEHEVDLVLLDVNLRGDMDGIEVASRIQEPRPAVVFLTAHGDDGTLARAESVEPAGYLVKPFDERTLYATVRMAVYRAEADKQRRGRMSMLSSALDRIDRAVLAVDATQTVQLVNAVTARRGVQTGTSLAQALTHLERADLLPHVQARLQDPDVATHPGFELVPSDHGALLVLGPASDGPLCLCAWCHKARDDQGDWQEVESVLRQRYALELTHGICQGCVETHFSDFMD